MVNAWYQCIFPPRASGNSDAREGARAVTVQHAARKDADRGGARFAAGTVLTCFLVKSFPWVY